MPYFDVPKPSPPALTFQLTRYIWIAVLTSVITIRPTAIIFVSSHHKRLKIRATNASLDKRSWVPVCPTPHFFTHKLKIYEASSGIRQRLWTHCLSAHRACWELWCQLSAFSSGNLHHLSSLCSSAVPRELVNYFWAAKGTESLLLLTGDSDGCLDLFFRALTSTVAISSLNIMYSRE